MINTVEEMAESNTAKTRLCGAGPERLHRFDLKARTCHHRKAVLVILRLKGLEIALLKSLVHEISDSFPVLCALESSIVGDGDCA